MRHLIYLLFFGLFMTTFQACSDEVDAVRYHYSAEDYELLSKTLNLPEETYKYTIVSTFSPNGVDDGQPFHKATLGRVLFYDKLLSKDESTSCASCHKQANGFADNTKFSEGLQGQIGKRNSLPLGNTIGFVRYYGTDLSSQAGFFSWDESRESINEQSKAAIKNPIEMGHDMISLTQKIQNQDYYKVLFAKVYPDGVTQNNILDALTDFVNSMSSRNSKFDEGAGSSSPVVNFENFTASENRGKTLFNNACSSCHDMNHNAIVMSHANNGLDLEYADKGMGVDKGEYYNGVFKVPSLRNIALTGPYMHDGRFETLEDVVDFYSTGIKNHDNLHNFLKVGNGSKKFNFTETEKNDLVAYLNTLTDESFVTEVKYSDPFK